MSTPTYLQEANVQAAGALVHGALWQDIKRVLMERRPEAGLPSDELHTAAAKGHIRNGFELAIKMIEEIPFDVLVAPQNPFDRPAITETAD